MSLDATRWAWRQKVTPTQKLVLLALADRADEKHICYPSNTRLQSDTGLYRETIYAAISDMEQSGILTVIRKQGCGNRYQLIGVEGREDQSAKAARFVKADQSAKPDQSGNADQSAKADETSREKPTTTSREKPTLNLPIESTKQSSLKSKAHGQISMLVANGATEQHAADWLEVRKAKRAGSVTQSVIDGVMREATLANLSFADAIRICCERGWQGFQAAWLEPKAQGAGGFKTASERRNENTDRAVAQFLSTPTETAIEGERIDD
jgi:hypothetical protein